MTKTTCLSLSIVPPLWLVVILASYCTRSIKAAVSLPKWFGDNMVLQAHGEYGALPFLNGKALPGEKVTVKIFFNSKVGDDDTSGPSFVTIADQDGNWKVQLDPIYHHSEFRIDVSGNTTQNDNTANIVTASNIRMGEVFLCSGQSNMEFPVSEVFNASQEIESLKDFPNFRFFVTHSDYAEAPLWDFSDDPKGSCANGVSCNRWITQEEALLGESLVSDEKEEFPDSFIRRFSSVCFMTVRDLARLHGTIGSNLPVGLIQATWGGTRVEAWMSEEAIQQSKLGPSIPEPMSPSNQKSVLYNAMIHPWAHFSIRAALWYQGEANDVQKDTTAYYSTMYQSMIADWRIKKGIGDFAWGTVQLPPSVPSGTTTDLQARDTHRMQIRLAQAESEPHPEGQTDISALAVTLDLGGSSVDGYNHPPNKNEISRRLALGLLHAAYGLQSPTWTGPVCIDASLALRSSQPGEDYAEHSVVVMRFSDTSVASGMALRDVKGANIDGTRNDCLQCCAQRPPFEVTDAERPNSDSAVWSLVPRNQTTIEGSSVVLDIFTPTSQVSSAPKKVTAVRYAWSDYVECVLENSEGLVASPFVANIISIPKSNETELRPSLRGMLDEGFSLVAGAARKKKRSAQSATIIDAPPMGFNSWNFYHCNIDENTVKAIADAMVTNGMKEAGYEYINIDDCWQVQRFSNGTIQPDPARFPSGMRALADYVHSRGLRFGLYTAQGSRTCQGRPGSFLHEEIDAATYCDWGVDYLKVDNCGGSSWPQLNTSWTKFRNAFDSCEKKTGRPIVLSVEYCRSVSGCGEWITRTANVWRTTGDIQATWSSVMYNIHRQDHMYPVARPGHFNDPDMLQIGNVGLTTPEQYSHMALWCIVSAPLLAGNDLIHATNTTMAILSNREAIAVNQDHGWNSVVQGHRVRNSTKSETWVKRLADGTWAVVLLNLSDDDFPLKLKLQWEDLGLEDSSHAIVRDIWAGKDIGIFSQHFTSEWLLQHESAFLRVSPHPPTNGSNFLESSASKC